MATITQRTGIVRRVVRPALAVAAVLALTGCIAYPGDYYGAAPGYPAYASYPAYPAPSYYAAAPVGIVIGGGGWGHGWGGGWGGGWGRGGHRWN